MESVDAPLEGPASAIGHGDRIVGLDALRGIASLIVVFGHCQLLLPSHPIYGAFPIRLFFDGSGAVILFFVLSGAVLAPTFLDKDGRRYAPYAVKRVARIYLPFLAAILLAAACDLIVGHAPIQGAGDWFNLHGWRSPVTLPFVLDHLTMIRQHELDNPMWSLVHEMRISFVLPLIAVLAAARWRIGIGLSLVVSIAATAILIVARRNSLAVNLLPTVQLLPLFALGATLALQGQNLTQRLRTLSPVLQALVLTAGVLLFAAFDLPAFDISGPAAWTSLMLASLGAAVFIAFALSGASLMRSVLNNRITSFLGKISYSLYLVHVIVLEVLVRLLSGKAPMLAILALVVVISLAVATAMQRWIERPAQRFGARLARRLAARGLQDRQLAVQT